MKTRKIVLNSLTAVFMQLLKILLGFILQREFIIHLGIEFLGYNSVFSNILQMLNLADMGIAVAITSFLYKPLAEDNKEEVNALMCLYKRVYSVLGLSVFFLGLLILLFLPSIIHDATCSNSYLRVLFFINIIGTVSGYYLGYYRTLMIASQKSYFANSVDAIVSTICTVFQIFILVFIPNYILYLVINVIRGILANFCIAVECKRENPYLFKSNDNTLILKYKNSISDYVKDVFISRIGSFVYYGTDNLIISYFLGSLHVGILSNYTLVTTSLQGIIIQIFSSLQATLGIEIARCRDDKKKQIFLTDIYFTGNYFLSNIVGVVCYFLIQSFLGLYVGKNLLLPDDIAAFLCINLALTVLLITPSQIFAIYGLYKYDKPVIAISAALNILISIILVRRYEIMGVLIGTFITSILYLISRIYIFSHRVYNVSSFHYYKRIILWGFITISSYFCCDLFIHHISVNSWIVWIATAILLMMICSAITGLMLCITKEFRILLLRLLKHSRKKIIILSESTVIILIALSMFVIIHRGGTSEGYKPDSGNKSLDRFGQYALSEETCLSDHVFNISVDDVSNVFIDLTLHQYEYNSIFENAYLNYYKSLHEKFGVVFSLYVFYKDGLFDLSQCTEKYKKEFIENSDWLKFGFHAWDSKTIYDDGSDRDLVNDYMVTTTELERIVGHESIDNVLRLASFQGKKQDIEKLSKLKSERIIGLLTADDMRNSYSLSDEDNTFIYSHDLLYQEDVYYISTDLRVEFIEDLPGKIQELETNTWINQLNIFTVFTHEWKLDEAVKEKIEKLCQYANERKYRNVFLEDYLSQDK